jgi:hypothetical protein
MTLTASRVKTIQSSQRHVVARWFREAVVGSEEGVFQEQVAYNPHHLQARPSSGYPSQGWPAVDRRWYFGAF